ncbi:glutathione S-transferase [Klebsormidium nitens]|uniref:Glutathione S-transferase n=1 Tax=Klebsormidium nitens TaxID=105231 RepID=A0A1Y1HPC0_KLENI|nr:glutathione S-transferase [Klebsormidium nitens]|eukprot:GAQ80470.1 glutathione S-transferase [Klebsormidium nitens]
MSAVDNKRARTEEAVGEGAKKLQLYSLATPNGQKIGVALEEMEIPYDAHTIDIFKNTQFEDWYVKINPNSKIPSIVDPNGPGGEEVHMMESCAILVYLAEKTGKFLSKDPIKRLETLQWLFFQAAHVGPMSGQYGHFQKHVGKRFAQFLHG